jgi:Fe-S-cluster-containing dehydrogenase component/formate-dependent nitrite reductase membrane component NrfD
VQLGFVIDHSRCIGCHACTVACKSENDVPVGSFRTWVKYTEQGEFPEVKRSFAVLRCNQCTDAPCVTICPVKALDKRPDGIVDVDPKACIGCKACMQGCPYDALYINDDTGTAQKCHFCAHRTEQGLAPACAVVCPTEAIIPGDFHDPLSSVSKMRDEHQLAGRKVEAGTGPNVLYREVAQAGIDPSLTSGVSGSIWTDTIQGPLQDTEAFEALETKAQARTTLDVPRSPLWGWKITAYLWLKSIAAGLGIVGAAIMAPVGISKHDWEIWVPALSMLFLMATLAVLVADLKRPERFLKILLRPNWSSWLARGSFILGAYGAVLAAWIAAWVVWWQPSGPLGWLLWGSTVVLAALSACYTAWLFGQAKGRPLWMRRGLSVHLIVQAVVAGAGMLLLLMPLIAPSGHLQSELMGPYLDAQVGTVLRSLLLGGLGVHLLFIAFEGRLAPPRREKEYERAHRLIVRGPYSRAHWLYGIVLGVMVPPVLLLWDGSSMIPWSIAGALALFGLWAEEDAMVRAGQALPIS